MNIAESQHFESLVRALGRVIIPIGRVGKIDHPPAKEGPEPSSRPVSTPSIAGVIWGTLVGSQVIHGEVIVPVENSANFTSAVQQSRKEVELMFETYFPKPLPEIPTVTTPDAKIQAPPTRQLEAEAPSGVVQPPAHTPPPEPEPVTPPPVPAPPAATPPPRSVTPATQATPRTTAGPVTTPPTARRGRPPRTMSLEAPAAATPPTPPPAPAPVAPPPAPIATRTKPTLVEAPIDPPEPPEAPEAPASDWPTGMTVEEAGDFEVNLNCKYIGQKLRSVINPDAIKWFATHEKTDSKEYADLRSAAKIWYDHLIATGVVK